MIAAIAIANGLAVYTCNPDDFVRVDGLEVMPVDVLARGRAVPASQHQRIPNERKRRTFIR